MRKESGKIILLIIAVCFSADKSQADYSVLAGKSRTQVRVKSLTQGVYCNKVKAQVSKKSFFEPVCNGLSVFSSQPNSMETIETTQQKCISKQTQCEKKLNAGEFACGTKSFNKAVANCNLTVAKLNRCVAQTFKEYRNIFAPLEQFACSTTDQIANSDFAGGLFSVDPRTIPACAKIKKSCPLLFQYNVLPRLYPKDFVGLN